jgi:hypothetical protein
MFPTAELLFQAAPFSPKSGVLAKPLFWRIDVQRSQVGRLPVRLTWGKLE